MPTKCSYPNCKTGTAADRNYNKAHGLKNKTLFRVPKDSLHREKWTNALGRSTALTNTESVCELHFKEADVKWFYETNLPDGSKVIMDRGKISLVPTAIPISVDATEEELRSTNVPRDSPIIFILPDTDASNTSADVEPIIDTYDEECDDTHDEECVYEPVFVDTVSDAPMNVETNAEEQNTARSFTKVIKDFEKMKRPNGWVCVDLTGRFAVAHWNPDGSSMKQLFVHPDFSVTAFIKNRKINVPGIINISSAQDILHNINIIQPLLLCYGMGNEFGYSEQCLGYTEPKERVKFGHNRCHPCNEAKRQMIRHNFKTVKSQAMRQNKYERLRKSLKADKIKFKRMKCTISSLKEAVLRTRRACAAMCKEVLQRKILKLDPNQQ